MPPLGWVIGLYGRFAQAEPFFFRFLLSCALAPPESEPYVLAEPHLSAQHALLETMFEAAVPDHGNMRGRARRYASSLLGLITTTAAAAVPQTQPARNSAVTHPEPLAAAQGNALWSYAKALPPTMKQRIRAEAHGKTPSCRHRSPADTETTAEPAAEPADCV